MCATPGCSTIMPGRIFCSDADSPRAASALSAALARPLPPRPLRAPAGAAGALAAVAKAAAGRTSRSCAVCRTGAGSTRRRRPGGTDVADRVAGPTWSRPSGCAPPASCWPPRIWTAIPATTGCAICARSASAATCSTTARTTWRNAGSPTVGAGPSATCSSAAMTRAPDCQRGRDGRHGTGEVAHRRRHAPAARRCCLAMRGDRLQAGRLRPRFGPA